MDTVRFLSQIKTRDAALIYFWLRDRLRGGTGLIGTTTFETLASRLNAAGLKTSRGALFTAAVVRARLNELEGVSAIIRDAVDAGAFILYVYEPKEEPAADPTECEPPVDYYAGKSLFDFHFENENENENQNEKTKSHKEEYIYQEINKQINNREGEARKAENVEALPTVEEATSRVDWADQDVQRLRSELARIVWEPEINPGLIDRLAAAGALGIAGADRRRCMRIARDAVNERDRYERTEGRAGKSHIWKALGYSVKKLYDAAGYEWTPTRPGVEPEPRRASVCPVAIATTPPAENPAKEITEADAEGFKVEDLKDDLTTFQAKVRARLHTKPGLETWTRALKIRNAIQGLKLAHCDHKPRY